MFVTLKTQLNSVVCNLSIIEMYKIGRAFMLACCDNWQHGFYTCRDHSVLVSSIFIGNVQKEVVSTWIIALAIIAGILLFMFLVIGLMKVSTVHSKVQFSLYGLLLWGSLISLFPCVQIKWRSRIVKFVQKYYFAYICNEISQCKMPLNLFTAPTVTCGTSGWTHPP
jgi:hypothetical protein